MSMSDDSQTTGRMEATGPDTSVEGLRDAIARAVRQVRATKPMAQSFTNFVTMNFVANAQLAVGGAAAMSFLPDDVLGTLDLSGADYVNVGTLLPFHREALPQIARGFHKAGHRWVLDPVAAGIGTTRTEILRSFRAVPPTIVRANASEVIALAGMWGLWPAASADTAENADATGTARTAGPVGVEAVDEVDAAIAPADALARFLASRSPDGRAAVAVSGAVDYVTDGGHGYRLPGGSELMTKVTGSGCSLGGVTAVYLAVADPLVAALAASAQYDRAGEAAAAKSDGPGTFQAHFLDALWNLTAEQIAASEIVPA